MKLKKIVDIIFEMATYINGVLATYEDKVWLRINILIKEDFLRRVKCIKNTLYIETI